MDTKNLGIWLDHSNANLIDLNTDNKRRSIDSKFSFSEKEAALSRSENLMHNKENQKHEAYYKKLGDAILAYDHVVLFGPTHAKTELYNFLSKDLHFKDIKIDVEPTDNMTYNEKNAFVKEHFEK